jgi:hypothetical protein
MKYRIRFECQLIVGNVWRCQVNKTRYVFDSALKVLPGQGEHQVNVDAVEIGGLCVFIRRTYVVGVMYSPKDAKHVCIKTLRSYRQSGHARLSIAFEAASLKRSRVRLHRDLAVRTDIQILSRGIEHAGDLLSCEETRGAATEEYGRDGPADCPPALESEIGYQGADVSVTRRTVPGSV